MPLTIDAGCRRRCLPTAGPPIPERSSRAGDSTAPQATTTVGARTVKSVTVPSGCSTFASTPDSAAILDQHTVGAAVDHHRRARVRCVLQVGLHRRLLGTPLAAGEAVAADPRVLAGRVDVAHDRAVLHPQLIQRADQLAVLAVLGRRLVGGVDPCHHGIDVLVVGRLVDALRSRARAIRGGPARECAGSSCS